MKEVKMERKAREAVLAVYERSFPQGYLSLDSAVCHALREAYEAGYEAGRGKGLEEAAKIGEAEIAYHDQWHKPWNAMVSVVVEKIRALKTKEEQ